LALFGKNDYLKQMADYQAMMAGLQQQAGMSPFAVLANHIVGGAPGIASPTLTIIDKAKIEALKKSEPRKVTAKIPDAVEPIVAWRAWKLLGMRLAALGSTGVWEPKKMMEAICNSSSSYHDLSYFQHPAPQSSCNCGMWGFKSLDNLLAAIQGKYTTSVIGQVSMWGRVIETENGWRAQFAYPRELWLLDSSLEELGMIYGVPVRTA